MSITVKLKASTNVDLDVATGNRNIDCGKQGNVQNTNVSSKCANKTLHVIVRSLFPYENACLQILKKLNVTVLKGVEIDKLLTAF